MEVSEQPCKSWFLIDRSFKDTILANDAYIKKRKCRIGFDFKSSLYILCTAHFMYVLVFVTLTRH